MTRRRTTVRTSVRFVTSWAWLGKALLVASAIVLRRFLPALESQMLIGSAGVLNEALAAAAWPSAGYWQELNHEAGHISSTEYLSRLS